jgi:hypothetical protein
LENNGFSVDGRHATSFAGIRARYQVPRDLEGCHVAEIRGIIVEGHVPASEIKAALAQLAAAGDITGVSVPGMPVGSPGMEGGTPEPYEVIWFGRSGRRIASRWIGSERQQG